MTYKEKNTQDSMEYDYLKPASFQDCTGLIPAAPADDAELENYKELYPFLPDVLLKDNSEETLD